MCRRRRLRRCRRWHAQQGVRPSRPSSPIPMIESHFVVIADYPSRGPASALTAAAAASALPPRRPRKVTKGTPFSASIKACFDSAAPTKPTGKPRMTAGGGAPCRSFRGHGTVLLGPNRSRQYRRPTASCQLFDGDRRASRVAALRRQGRISNSTQNGIRSRQSMAHDACIHHSDVGHDCLPSAKAFRPFETMSSE